MWDAFLLGITGWSSPFYRTWLRLHNSLWERRPQTIFSPFQCNYRELEAYGVWLRASQLCGGPVRISVPKGPQVAGADISRRCWRDRKRWLWGFPRGGWDHLFVPSFSSEGAFGPLGSLTLKSFLFPFSCSDSHSSFHIAVSLKSALQVKPASRRCLFTWV